MSKEEMGCEYRVYKDTKGRKHYPVQCNEQGLKCERCGWNPQVEKERIKKIKEKMR